MAMDYTGVSELCTLFLREPYRKGRNGRVLSKYRLLFMAQFRERFAKQVIAEMRGISDEDGPFSVLGVVGKTLLYHGLPER